VPANRNARNIWSYTKRRKGRRGEMMILYCAPVCRRAEDLSFCVEEEKIARSELEANVADPAVVNEIAALKLTIETLKKEVFMLNFVAHKL
jgi:hypothetical protein